MYTLPLRLPLLVTQTTSQEFGTEYSKITPSTKWALARPVALGSDQCGVPEKAVH